LKKEERYKFNIFLHDNIEKEINDRKIPIFDEISPKLALERGNDYFQYLYLPERHFWSKWDDLIPKLILYRDTEFSEITVPTAESVSLTYLINTLVTHEYACLLIGETGTGKT
jgi:hypothetical protein